MDANFELLDESLHGERIAALLPASCRIGREIVVLQETTSTNDVAAQLGRSGAPEGVVVFAERQSAGRGRLQRKWESAAQRGLWFSVLLRPAWAASAWARLTTWAGVGIAQGLEEALPGCRATLKWPNDVYLRGKKAVGILSESAAGPDGWAVVGIGVNVNHAEEDFPGELRSRATSLRAMAGADAPPLDRNAVAAALLRRLDASYTALEKDFAGIVAEAELRSAIIGSRITVHAPAETYEAMAEGLEPDGSLRVRGDDGAVRIISGGEVSIRGF